MTTESLRAAGQRTDDFGPSDTDTSAEGTSSSLFDPCDQVRRVERCRANADESTRLIRKQGFKARIKEREVSLKCLDRL